MCKQKKKKKGEMKINWSSFKIPIVIPDQYNLPQLNSSDVLEENPYSSVYQSAEDSSMAYQVVLITPEDCTIANIQLLTKWIQSTSCEFIPKIVREFIIENAIMDITGKIVQLYVFVFERSELTLDRFIEESIHRKHSLNEISIHLGYIAFQLLKAYQKLTSHEIDQIRDNPARVIFNPFIYLRRDGSIRTWLLPQWTPRDFLIDNFIDLRLEKHLERSLTSLEKSELRGALQVKVPGYSKTLHELVTFPVTPHVVAPVVTSSPTTSIQNVLNTSSEPLFFMIDWITSNSSQVKISNQKLQFTSLKFQAYMAPFGVYQFTTAMSSKIRTCLIGLDNDRIPILNAIQSIPWFPRYTRLISEIPVSDPFQSYPISVFVLELDVHFRVNLFDYYRNFIKSSTEKIRSLIQKVDPDKLAYGLLPYLKRAHQSELEIILKEWVDCARLLTQVTGIAQQVYSEQFTSVLCSHINLFNALVDPTEKQIHVISLVRSSRIQQNPQGFLDACQFNLYNTFQSLLKNSTPEIKNKSFLVNGILYLFYDHLKKNMDNIAEILDPVSEQHFVQIYGKLKIY